MLSNRVKNVSQSVTLNLAARVKQMIADGQNIINCSAGEPNFSAPKEVCEAAKRAISEGKTTYTASGGILSLRQAICEKLANENGLVYTPEQIIVGNGAKQCLHGALTALVQKGDEVIVPVPYWTSYPDLVALCDAKVVLLKTSERNSFKIKPEDLKKAITPKTKVLILNNPCNPTGAMYSRSELDAIAEVVEKSQIYVVSDEIYEKYNYSGQPFVSFASCNNMFDRTVTVNGFSKTYSMMGFRMGYAAGTAEIIGAMTDTQSHQTGSPCTISQYAALEAVTSVAVKEYIENEISEFVERRDYVLGRMEKFKHIYATAPDGAFYMFVNVSKLFGKNYENIVITEVGHLCEMLLTNANLAVVPGTAFGAPNYVRLSFAASLDDLKTAMDNLQNFLIKIK